MSEFMDQSTKGTQPMFPTGSEDYRPSAEPHINTSRALDPHTSIEDYSRVMLQYTQNRMSGFARLDDDKGSSGSRSGSDTGNESGDSASGVLARQADGRNSTARSSSASLSNPPLSNGEKLNSIKDQP
ncbi:hypothetical protein P170DRAFT_471843 [Aspergillus steynii IBT 23096]|uniref:Uncharacterized protein n=1 Tax=Aspergillus steynii IBT 23096 TaxID=1392250 RepID=A0A2I2GGF2_9EURO|nr:uncharacterized protein P170DRAFT_471843 [Aspergillus steynii IBT 23096]PLB51917.1 hypothetical protein P170DRAFT_471843 [Aspergillus steynii IBT 23096]